MNCAYCGKRITKNDDVVQITYGYLKDGKFVRDESEDIEYLHEDCEFFGGT